MNRTRFQYYPLSHDTAEKLKERGIRLYNRKRTPGKYVLKETGGPYEFEGKPTTEERTRYNYGLVKIMTGLVKEFRLLDLHAPQDVRLMLITTDDGIPLEKKERDDITKVFQIMNDYYSLAQVFYDNLVYLGLDRRELAKEPRLAEQERLLSQRPPYDFYGYAQKWLKRLTILGKIQPSGLLHAVEFLKKTYTRAMDSYTAYLQQSLE